MREPLADAAQGGDAVESAAAHDEEVALLRGRQQGVERLALVPFHVDRRRADPRSAPPYRPSKRSAAAGRRADWRGREPRSAPSGTASSRRCPTASEEGNSSTVVAGVRSAPLREPREEASWPCRQARSLLLDYVRASRERRALRAHGRSRPGASGSGHPGRGARRRLRSAPWPAPRRPARRSGFRPTLGSRRSRREPRPRRLRPRGDEVFPPGASMRCAW